MGRWILPLRAGDERTGVPGGASRARGRRRGAALRGRAALPRMLRVVGEGARARAPRGRADAPRPCRGGLRFRECAASWGRGRELARPAAARMELDLSGVEHLDGAATALLLDLRGELAATGAQAKTVGGAAPLRARG